MEEARNYQKKDGVPAEKRERKREGRKHDQLRRI
jgi:hypothetical protein